MTAKEKGYAPSIDEMAENLGIGRSTCVAHLAGLKRKKCIDSLSGIPRTLHVVPRSFQFRARHK